MDRHYPFAKKPLPFDYISLEPCFDPDTVYLHHAKAYALYVDTLNYLLAPYPQYQDWSLEKLISEPLLLPAAVQNNIKHYAGAVFNHDLYFDGISPQGTTTAHGQLAQKLTQSYGSPEQFQKLFRQAAHNVLGAGWVWLCSLLDGEVRIVLSSNNEVPSMELFAPILVLDTWEHAYFLRYPVQLGDYVNNWFKVIDWNKAEARYQASLKK